MLPFPVSFLSFVPLMGRRLSCCSGSAGVLVKISAQRKVFRHRITGCSIAMIYGILVVFSPLFEPEYFVLVSAFPEAESFLLPSSNGLL
jgi:hypothetical protein